MKLSTSPVPFGLRYRSPAWAFRSVQVGTGNGASAALALALNSVATALLMPR
jgi:hypothetical protein